MNEKLEKLHGSDKVMFRKAEPRRLSRSASFSAKQTSASSDASPVRRAAVVGAASRNRTTSLNFVIPEDLGGESPPAAGELVAVQARLNHLEKRLEQVHASATDAGLAGRVDKLVAERLEGVGERVALHFGDLEELRAENMKLSLKLGESLEMLSRRTKLLEDLLEHVFHTSRTTLQKEPDSMLAAMFSGRFKLSRDEDGCYFVDRDGQQFHHILRWLRTGKPPPTTLEEQERQELEEDCQFFGLHRLEAVLAGQRNRAEEENPAVERSTMLNIQSIATSNYVQGIIAVLAEVTHLAFRQMAVDAEAGRDHTLLSFAPGQPYYEFFVGDDKQKQHSLSIFIELLRQEGVSCVLLPQPIGVHIRCELLRSDQEICHEVLRNFKKMRGFARGPGGNGAGGAAAGAGGGGAAGDVTL